MTDTRHPLTRWIGPAVIVLSAALYIRTLCPTLGGAFDSEELQHTAYTFSVAHATGYPLYLILGGVFSNLLPFGNVAFRVNLLSALITSVAVAFVYWNALLLARRQLASIATAAVFATNAAVWRQAGVASVGPLHLLLIAAIVNALLLWHLRRLPLSVAAFLFGLGLAHHRTTLFLALPIAIFVLLDDPGFLRRPRELLKSAIWLVLPLLLYLYIPIRGGATPWYTNTLEGLIGEVSGGDAGAFIRATPSEIAQGIMLAAQYLFDSFGYLGLGLIAWGALSQWPLRRANREGSTRIGLLLFLGLSTLLYTAWGTLYAGEPDRYLVLPFMFLIYWFALGAGALEDWLDLRFREGYAHRAAQGIIAAALALVMVLPFGDHLHAADWSSFDRVYKQWDEIFTLPLPQGATLVGNWGQLNAMRYMQRIEHRRPDLQFLGTLYDPAPQTQAAQAAFAEHRSIFLSPGIPLPSGSFRYDLLGPLVNVRDTPQTTKPDQISSISANTGIDGIELAGFDLTTALEPYEPSHSLSIAPGRTGRVTMYWHTDEHTSDYAVRLRLYDPVDRLIVQKDEPPVRGLYPASQWAPGEYVVDVHNLLIPPGTPPGVYQINYALVTNGQPGTVFPLAQISVEPATNLARDTVFVQHPIDVALDRRVAVWGYGGLDQPLRAGGQLSFSLLWSVLEKVDADFSVHFRLVNPLGGTVADWLLPPISYYPPSKWQAGELLKAFYELPLPESIPSGVFVLTVGRDQEQAVPFAKIQIVP